MSKMKCVSRRRLSRILFTAAAGGAVLVTHAQAQTSGTWIADVGTAGGVWSNPAHWSGGMVADNGGVATFNTLPTFTTAPLAIIQDLPSVSLSGINFESQITYLLRPAAAGANTLALTGPAVLNTPIPSINTLSSTFFGHQMSITLTGSSGLTKSGPGTVTLWQPNTFTGGTRINGGILVARQFGDAVFGDSAGSVSLNDGTIRVTTSGWTSSRVIHLAGNGTFESGTTQGITFNGPVIGTGDLNKIGSNGLTLTAANGYSGATNLLGGTMTLNGNGALVLTSAVALRNTLTLDNAATNLTDRVNNNAPVTLFGSGIALTGNASAPSSEQLGSITLSRGQTTFTVTAGAGQDASLSAPSISRDTGGAAFFRGTNLGGGGAGGSNITFTAAPHLIGAGGSAGSTDISIIPWAYGNTNAAAALNAATNSFVTYGAGGVRPLDIGTEYASTLAPGISADNVRLTAAGSVTTTSTVNSLILTGASNITGSGTLSITSGALLNLSNGLAIAPALDFGAAEGMIFAPASITFNGPISGNNGIVKHGAGVATFANASSTYMGPTVIAGGTAAFVSNIPASGNGPFGSDTSAVILAPAGLGTGGTTARLVYAGAGTGAFDRDLLVSGRIAVNNAATIPGFGASGTNVSLVMNGGITLDGSPMSFVGDAGSTVTVNGVISGNGGPITDQASSATSTIVLNGNNTFSEGAEISKGVWAVGSDSAFGTGPIKMVQLSGFPTIVAAGGPRIIPNDTVSFSNVATMWVIGGENELTFTGRINLSGSYTHNISNTALTTYAGVLHTGAFTKTGTGTLLLSGDNIYTGNTTISAGTLRITHANALGSTAAPTIVASGAALEIAGNALTQEPVTISGSGVGNGGAIRSVSGSNTLGHVTVAANAALRVDAGSLAVGNVSAAPGTQGLLKDGAGHLGAQRYRVGSLSVAEGIAAVAAGRSTDKTSVVSALSVASGARLDLGDNDLVVDYAAETPLPAIRDRIASAYSNGAWTGDGITSSLANASSFALGYGESSAVFTSFPASFSGVDVDDTAVLVRYTRYGDANLDGLVNLADFNRLAANFGLQSGALWTQGDFNYDGIVNLADFNRLAANFGLQAGPDGPTPDDWSNLASAVPEPVGIGAVAAVAPLLGRRRRRR